MAKEFLKIWFSDIETAHDFFDKNDKHLGEFLVNVYRSYAELPTSFRCKHVEKYFKTYQKQIDFIKKAKADGMKAHLQEPETEDFSTATLEGGVKGVVEAPLLATLPAKGEKIKGKRIKGEKKIEKESIQLKTFVRENVSLLDEEIEKLVSVHGKEKTDWMFDKLNNYKIASGKKYKSDYHAILNWVINEYQNKNQIKQNNTIYIPGRPATK
jgi:hypothetical protein